MKQITIILCLLLAGHFSFSQERTEIGITAEGAWFMPYRTEIPYTANDWATKNGFGVGVGVYASHNLLWRISADIGIIYRYKQMQQHYSVYSQTTEGYSQYPYEPGHSSSENETVKIEGWDKLPMHYVVVPLHLQLLIGKNLFVKGGFETSWLLNYNIVNEKPEFNWVIGFGSQKHKLKWSVNYIRGFKEQGFAQKGIKPDGHYKGSINRNNMLQLKLSYPLGQLKF